MGAVPLNYSELHAWQKCFNAQLSAWEFRTLRNLSTEYLTQSQKSTKLTCEAPYGPITNLAAQRAMVEDKIDAAFG